MHFFIKANVKITVGFSVKKAPPYRDEGALFLWCEQMPRVLDRSSLKAPDESKNCANLFLTFGHFICYSLFCNV